MQQSKLTRRNMLKLAGMTGAAAYLAGCGGASIAPTPTAAGGSKAAAPYTSTKEVSLTYTFWGRPAVLEMTNKNIAEFNKTYPKIKITPFYEPDQYATKLKTKIAGNDAPDVFWLASDNFLEFQGMKTMVDLTPFVERDNGKDFDYSDIWPVQKDFEKDNRIWGILRSTSTYGLWYNLELFDKAGVKYPDDTWGWKEFLDAAKKLTVRSGDTITQYAYARHAWQNWVWANGGEIMVGKDGKFKSGMAMPETIEALQFLQDMVFKDKVSQDPVAQKALQSTQAMFETGKAAMLDEMTARVADFRTSMKDMKWDVAPIPKGSKGGRASFQRPNGRHISTQCKNPEEAWIWIKYLLSKPAQTLEAQAANSIVPSKSMCQSTVWADPNKPPKSIKVFLDMLAVGRVNPYHPKFSQISSEAMTPSLDRLWANKMTAEQACKEMDAAINAQLKEWNELMA